MFPYILVFISSVLVDCIPVFAPPAWMLMMLIMLKFNLNPFAVVVIGTFGTVSGRLIFVNYVIPWLGKSVIGKQKDSDLQYLGEKISQKGWLAFIFIFIYSFLPLSTTALFTAVGLARVRKIFVIPPFFLGNLIGDGLILVSGKYAVRNIGDLYKGSFELKNILIMSAGLLAVLIFLFVDWRTLLEKKNLTLKWQFWQ